MPRLGRLLENSRYRVIVAVVGNGAQAMAIFGWAVAITIEFICVPPGDRLISSS